MTQIAISQLTARTDFEANVAHAMEHVREAHGLGARLLAFPEVFLYVGGRAGKLAHAIELEGATVSRFRDEAARTGMMLLLGSFHERIEGDPEHVHNTSLLIGDGGELLAVYRKINLFDLDLPNLKLRESDTIRAGREPPPVVDTPIGRIGLTICFDLRFPELYLGLRERGAEVVFIPSNFTVPTGAAHWEVMLRARAIEGQFFVAAPAQVGEHSPRYRSFGHGMVVDPWGSVIAINRGGPGVLCAEVDRAQIERVRAELPMKRGDAVAALREAS